MASWISVLFPYRVSVKKPRFPLKLSNKRPFPIQKSNANDSDQSTRLCKDLKLFCCQDLKLFCCQEKARGWGHPPSWLSSGARAWKGRARARRPPGSYLPCHPESVGIQDSCSAFSQMTLKDWSKLTATKAPEVN